MAKYEHKITTTETITIDGTVDENGDIIVDGEPKDIAKILLGFAGEDLKISFTHKKEKKFKEDEEE